MGGVGYRFLRDLSFGPLLTDELRSEEWPEGVEIEDLSYGPVAILHNLDARPKYDRLVLIAGVKRGRRPGSVTRYRWDGRLPDEEEIQARIEEAGSGVISLDNLLVFLTYFRRMPEDVVVIEVEGADEDWGEGFTPEVDHRHHLRRKRPEMPPRGACSSRDSGTCSSATTVSACGFSSVSRRACSLPVSSSSKSVPAA